MLAIQLLPERDCKTCTALNKRDWGCEADAPIPMVMDGEELWRCPRRPILDHPGEIEATIIAYRAYMRGYLPDDGQLEDQGYRFVVTMAIMENVIAEAEAELDRRARRKAAQKNHGG